jgi:CheY-like chemotaxis protein
VILLVEDDGPVRAVTSRILTGAGYQVVEAASGQIALELGNRPGARFDLVLSDVVMPGISGLDTVNQLRLRHPDLPCVFMTGFSVERSGALEARVARGARQALRSRLAARDRVRGAVRRPEAGDLTQSSLRASTSRARG